MLLHPKPDIIAERVRLWVGGGMMALMTAQPPLPIAPVVGVEIGAAVVLVEDADGGRVFLHGNLTYT